MRHGQLVEVGDVRDIFARPQHPYTRLLMDSLPSLRQRGRFELSPA
jgi:oligopeptide/dipeptide ABC transporter ATP-binding protein